MWNSAHEKLYCILLRNVHISELGPYSFPTQAMIYVNSLGFWVVKCAK